MIKRIQNICEEICGKTLALNEELIISDLLDSYGIMELVCTLENEFRIAFLPEEISELKNFSCVEKIQEVVNKKIKNEKNRGL